MTRMLLPLTVTKENIAKALKRMGTTRVTKTINTKKMEYENHGEEITKTISIEGHIIANGQNLGHNRPSGIRRNKGLSVQGKGQKSGQFVTVMQGKEAIARLKLNEVEDVTIDEVHLSLLRYRPVN